MWKIFTYSENVYMIKNIPNEEEIAIYLTDLKNLWMEEIVEDCLICRFQELNTTLDIKRKAIVSEVSELVENITSGVDINITETDDGLKVDLKHKISDFWMKFSFKLQLASSDKFMEEVTVPLIHSVKYLEEQQKKLCELLEKKDRELEEYHLEKGNITRKDLMTDKFDRSTVDTNAEDLMLKVFEDPESWDNFKNKYALPEVKTLEVTKEKWNTMKRKKKVYSSKTGVKKFKDLYTQSS